jgi:hypothetical protein
LGRVSTASTTMGAPACITTVGLAVGAVAGAGEACWTWLDDCGCEIGAMPWLMEDEGVFADLGEAAGAWLAACGADAGLVL